MLNKVKTMITIMVLSLILISGNAKAATIQVKKGDTLWELSNEHETTVEKLKEWNRLHTDVIQTGDVLTVSPEAGYTVQNGDTLWDIAKAHDIEVSQLMERNSLTSDLIHPGLNLVIPTSAANSSEATTEGQSSQVQSENTQEKVAAAPVHKKTVTRVEAASKSVPSSGRVIQVTATAYTASCAGCSGITATGVNVKANPNARVISVDPSVIPLGSKVSIEGLGTYTAADTGGAIKGNRIDVLMATERAALQFGRKHLKLTILD